MMKLALVCLVLGTLCVLSTATTSEAPENQGSVVHLGREADAALKKREDAADNATPPDGADAADAVEAAGAPAPAPAQEAPSEVASEGKKPGELAENEYWNPTEEYRKNDQYCRGPCPLMNTLANYGYIPRDGKMLEPKLLAAAFEKHMGLDKGFAELFATKAGGKFMLNGATHFSLCTIRRSVNDDPAGVEHDGSLSRADRPQGEDAEAGQLTQARPTPEWIEADLNFVAELKGKKSSAELQDTDMITMDEMVKLRAWIWKKSETANPHIKQLRLQKIIGDVESILVLRVLGGAHGQKESEISVGDFKSWILNEKMPEGFQPAKDIGTASIGLSVAKFVTTGGLDSFTDKIKATLKPLSVMFGDWKSSVAASVKKGWENTKKWFSGDDDKSKKK